MPEFSYKATSSGGEVSSGRLHAPDERQAASILQRQGLIPLRIAAADNSPAEVAPGAAYTPARTRSPRLKISGRSMPEFSEWLDKMPWRRPGVKELAGFAEDLGLLLKAGVPLNRALVILVELVEKPLFSRVMESLREQVKEGSTFWEALGSHPQIFPPVFIGMVRAGESGGILDAALGRLALYLNEIFVRSRIRMTTLSP